MSITGDAAGPPYRLGVAISDLVTGMFAAQGVLVALLARERSGRGQRVDVGLLDSTVALLTYQASFFFATGTTAGRMGNRHPTIVPYETFEASDGEFVLAVGNDEQFARFCGVAGMQALLAEDRFATNPARVVNANALRDVLIPVLRVRSRQQWIESLTATGVPCGAVREVPEVLSDPQVLARDMIAAVEHAALGQMKVLGVPIKLSDTPGAVRTAPPTLGQHTEQVLRELDLSPDAIDELRRRKVI